MNVFEVRSKKIDLQEVLKIAIQNELDKFKKETGLSVKEMLISFTNVSAYKDKLPTYIMTDLRVSLAIDE